MTAKTRTQGKSERQIVRIDWQGYVESLEYTRSRTEQLGRDVLYMLFPSVSSVWHHNSTRLTHVLRTPFGK
jgi:hypothetical protein